MPPPDYGLWFLVSYGLVWVALIVQAILLLALLRQVGILSLRIVPLGARVTDDGLAIGAPAPEFHAVDLDDPSQRLDVPSPRRRPIILVFITPGCANCSDLMTGFKAVRRDDRAIDWAVVAVGDPEACRTFRRRHGLGGVLFCRADESVRMQFRFGRTPFAMLIGGDGKVWSQGIVNHIEHLESLSNIAGRGHAPAEENPDGRAYLDVGSGV